MEGKKVIMYAALALLLFVIVLVVIAPTNNAPECSLGVDPEWEAIYIDPTYVASFVWSASDSDGYIASWSFDGDDDGVPEMVGYDDLGGGCTWSYDVDGTYTARLTVTDDDGSSSSDTVRFSVYSNELTLL